jgi:hypothetical protein
MMKNNLDKQLEERRKKSDGDFEHRIAWCKNFWKLIMVHPLTYLILGFFCFYCFGKYYEWQIKKMIQDGFGYILVSLITGLIQHFVTKEKK